MRVLALAAAITLAACTHLRSGQTAGSGGAQSIFINVNAKTSTLVGIATDQLTASGFTVTRLADSTLVTSPAALPDHVRTDANKDQQWVLQVRAEKMFLMSGSRLRVTGFIVPPISNQPVDTMTVRRATPITSSNAALFNEVRTIANAIAKAAAGKK